LSYELQELSSVAQVSWEKILGLSTLLLVDPLNREFLINKTSHIII